MCVYLCGCIYCSNARIALNANLLLFLLPYYATPSFVLLLPLLYLANIPNGHKMFLFMYVCMYVHMYAVCILHMTATATGKRDCNGDSNSNSNSDCNCNSSSSSRGMQGDMRTEGSARLDSSREQGRGKGSLIAAELL